MSDSTHEYTPARAARLARSGELPPNAVVNGWLDLSGTQITALPEGLTVHGSLYLSGTQITALPEGLTVHGSLYLSGETKLQYPTAWWNTGTATRYRALASDGEYALYQTDTGLLAAGCRGPWTVKQALAHWGRPSRTDRRAKMFVAAINEAAAE